ncbi:sporulation peptidase YabG [Romboutsia weinsteinii]|uniref:Sporulation peptidase YabG n=1 Tax=Romboutsia weinsteinii TaxID=2020949 RepID=A0A371J260_9FIRM|nr:sporulation peptidase YabG [Romboutsia weinsteinii]RDY26758.1 sporulation peptidase YabG [Romboutsia weinsteinii]
MEVGNIVTRNSYNNDICFRICELNNNIAILKGTSFRLIADASIDDLNILSKKEYEIKEHDINKVMGNRLSSLIYECKNTNIFSRNNLDNLKKIGKILHIDGDNYYLNKSIENYNMLEIPAVGIYLNESEQPEKIVSLLKEHNPSILIITGHDNLARGYNNWSDIDNYRNSKYFKESVEKARIFNPNYDQLVIFAGGCQSYYEELIDAGANFASSPNRTLIHHLDPVLLAYQIATTSIREFIDVEEAVKDTFGGMGGIGGMETRGQSREIKPVFKNKKIY